MGGEGKGRFLYSSALWVFLKTLSKSVCLTRPRFIPEAGAAASVNSPVFLSSVLTLSVSNGVFMFPFLGLAFGRVAAGGSVVPGDVDPLSDPESESEELEDDEDDGPGRSPRNLTAGIEA